VWSFTVVEAVTVEYAVSSSEDDGYAFNEEGQNLEYAYLRVGSSAFAQPPYYISGMVFRNVNIPRGAEIISAYLMIRSDDTRLTDRVYGKIEAEAVDNAMGFGASHHIGSLPRTAASVDWDLDEPWSAYTWYESPDIADVIQEVIDHDGWSTGNSLAILYSTRQPGGGYRNFSSCDGGNGDFAPKLEITYGSK
jgi:type IV pilus assembly protein PilY1